MNVFTLDLITSKVKAAAPDLCMGSTLPKTFYFSTSIFDLYTLFLHN